MSQPRSSIASDIDALRTLVAKGDLVAAKLQVQTLLEKEAENTEAWRLKADIHKRLGDGATTIICLNQALKLDPTHAATALELAMVLEVAQKDTLAIKTYEHWLKILQSLPAIRVSGGTSPEADSWFEKGNQRFMARDFTAARDHYHKALSYYPDSYDILLNLGITYYQLGQLEKAEEFLLRALRSKPGHARILGALGNCFTATQQPLRAIACYRLAAEADPKSIDAWVNLGKAYFNRKDYDEAIAAYERTLALDPDHADALTELMHMFSYLCYWDRVDAIKQSVARIVKKGGSAGPFMVLAHLPELQCENAKHWQLRTYPDCKPYDTSARLPADARGDGKLRIGYLSSDFHQHATTALITQLFEEHDCNRFEIYAYSYGKSDDSAERKRIIATAREFRDIAAIDNYAAADLIRADGIDIMIDLKGHTQGTRIGLLDSRPAPIQMHYLGYPGTTGMPAIDYFIADPVSAPPGMEKDFTEQLIRLPHTYQINDRARVLPEAALPRMAYELPENAFVFCDFNNGYKITPAVFDVWMRLLKAAPDSVLWLYYNHKTVCENLRKEAKKRGVDPERLIFAPAVALNLHLMRYRHVDLFLDTAPVCGHTTASDALWCGVPVITLPGNSFISRVAASLLGAVGLPELAVKNLEAYEALALALYRDKERLAALKAHLEKGRMQFPLFDSKATTRALEAAYLHAATLHRSGQKPQHFSLTPDLAVA